MKACKSADYFTSQFQLGIFFFIKNILVMKPLIDFLKTVETSVDPPPAAATGVPPANWDFKTWGPH